ncbi:STM3941 family protein [Gracilibacillus kekensis]|uniref:Uncharacterized protein n=1 Tax=Gracilibacillus kekensis TaxID=1027249 RepID=A0A1M7JN14_9BACI|nr:STM3941 family protein [Gracilibacillus kekensis]SHM54499.1 hypothetical protein SAMN05216179_0424 [Gracilibacillus kekensis]
MDKSHEFCFYVSKFKLVFLIFIMSAMGVLDVFILEQAYNNGDTSAVFISAFIFLFTVFIIYLLIKKLLKNAPYLIIKNEGLIINANSKRPHFVKWEDIEGYKIREMNFYKYIDIILKNEEVYREKLVKRGTKFDKLFLKRKRDLFSIILSNVRRKDRKQLIRLLDERASITNSSSLAIALNEKHDSQVNVKYFLKSYAIAFLLTVVIYFIFFHPSNKDTYFIVSFCFYPFARIVYDVPIGFQLSFRMKRQSFVSHYFLQLQFFITVLILFLSVFLAPLEFCILYGKESSVCGKEKNLLMIPIQIIKKNINKLSNCLFNNPIWKISHNPVNT